MPQQHGLKLAGVQTTKTKPPTRGVFIACEVTRLSRYFVTIWVSIEMLLVGGVGWLIVLFNLPRQTSSAKLEGIINE